MNLKELILSSGILEDYALGSASETDAKGVECLARCYPEIQEEIFLIQNSLQRYAEQYKVNPPEGLKEKIWLSIQNDTAPSAQSAKPHLKGASGNLTAIIFKQKKWIAAASVLFVFTGLLLYSLYLHRQLKETNNRFALLETETKLYQKELQAQKEAYGLVRSQFDFLLDPFTEKVVLRGTSIQPEALATVYWNKNLQEVYVAINNLPQPPEDKQFQLWALVDGRPFDAGVIDEVSALNVQKMKSFKYADAFAITLEQKGGSQVPTLEAMYVIGTL